MIIHLDNTRRLLQKMVHALEVDPVAFQGWSCLHLPMLLKTPFAIVPQMSRTAVMSLLEKELAVYDGAIVLCEGGDIIAIVRSDSQREIRRVAEKVSLAFWGQVPEHDGYSLYLVSQDWRAVRWLLATKAAPALDEAYTPYQPDEHPMPEFTAEFDALQTVFAQAKRMRQVRSPHSVLLVEDDAITQRVIEKVLAQDYVLHKADGAFDAVSSYLMQAPDIMFLDINLPDRSGLDVLRQIRRYDPTAYIVMLSAQNNLNTILEALECGAAGFVAKPFEPQQLRHYILTKSYDADHQRGYLYN